jgi:coproporphyrinogen III oxidase-like Fe-S oxidoreductase
MRHGHTRPVKWLLLTSWVTNAVYFNMVTVEIVHRHSSVKQHNRKGISQVYVGGGTCHY